MTMQGQARVYSNVREGERARFWRRRSTRIFKRDEAWFIATREGIDLGPFGCRFDAEIEHEILIKQLTKCSASQSRRIINRQALARGPSSYLLNTDYLVQEGGAGLLKRNKA